MTEHHPETPQEPRQEPMWPQTGPHYPTQAYDPYAPTHRVARNGLGTAGMVVGIIAVVFCWIPFVGLALALVATVLSIFGLRRATGSQPTATNKGMAITGLVTGIVALGFAVFMTVAIFAVSDDLDRYDQCVDRADTARELARC